MRRLWYGPAAATVLALVSPALAAAQEFHLAEIRTPLHGLAPGEGLLFRAAEVLRGAPPYSLSWVVLNERNVIVKRGVGTVAPGAPLTFRVNREELPVGDPWPAVRAVLRLTRTGDGTFNEPFVTFEFFDRDGPSHRNGGVCMSVKPCPPTTLADQGQSPAACVGPPARGGGPITHCEGALLSNMEPSSPPDPLPQNQD